MLLLLFANNLCKFKMLKFQTFLIFSISFLVFVHSQYFNGVTFKVFRDTKPAVQLLNCDNVNLEKDATEIKAEGHTIPNLVTGAFNDLPKLKYIKLQHNGIQHLGISAFLNIPNIQIINLNFNEIGEIRHGVFSDLNITKIYLIGNKVKTVFEHAFYNLPYLQILDLSSNRIEQLSQFTFFNLGSLQKVYLNYNKLQYVPDRFFEDAFLRAVQEQDSVIDLSHNNLRCIDANVFRGVHFIRTLLLSHNVISEIHKNAFNDLMYIDTLDLQGNLILKIAKNGALRNANVLL